MKRLGHLRKLKERALRALENREWFDGYRWHSDHETPAPRRLGESLDAYRGRVSEWIRHQTALKKRYKSPDDVLQEVFAQMLGRGDAVERFERSIQADREEHASTPKEIKADEIFAAAQPYLRMKPRRNGSGFSSDPAPRTAWTALAHHLSHQRREEITPNRLRQICRHRGEK